MARPTAPGPITVAFGGLSVPPVPGHPRLPGRHLPLLTGTGRPGLSLGPGVAHENHDPLRHRTVPCTGPGWLRPARAVLPALGHQRPQRQRHHRVWRDRRQRGAFALSKVPSTLCRTDPREEGGQHNLNARAYLYNKYFSEYKNAHQSCVTWCALERPWMR